MLSYVCSPKESKFCHEFLKYSEVLGQTPLKYANTCLTLNWRHIKQSISQLGVKSRNLKMTVVLHPSGRSHCSLVLLMLNATWPDPVQLCPSPSVHTQQREKSWSLHCKFTTVTKAAFSLLVCFSNMLFFLRFYSSYLLLGLIVTL